MFHSHCAPSYRDARRLIERNRCGVLIINIIIHGLDSIVTGTEDAVPEACLLAIVVALPVALAMVQIMVLDDNIRVEPS